MLICTNLISATVSAVSFLTFTICDAVRTTSSARMDTFFKSMIVGFAFALTVSIY